MVGTGNEKRRKKDFYHELLTLAIPIGLQNLLVALVGASDALMLGRLTQDAVSAVSLANQIAFIMNLFIGAVVSGGGALIAQYWGKGDRQMVKNLFCTIVKYAFFISIIFFAAALFFSKQLMRIYTNDSELIRIGASYLRVVSFSYLFSGITQCYFLVMKVEGNATKSVIISVATLIADMTIDFFLIYGIAGVPALGANGSAYSTVVVEIIALIWCIVESYRPKSIHLERQSMKWFSSIVIKDMFRIALPMLASSLAWGLGFSMHSLIMGHLGTDATAAASITSVAQELITCVCKGISSGAGIITGKLLGKNMFDKAKEYGEKFCHISFWTGGIHMGLLCVLSPIVTHFFVLSDNAKYYLTTMLIFSSFYVFAYSVNTIIVCGIFPSGGDAKYDAISVFYATWCFSLPFALLGTFVFHWSVMAIYIIMMADEIVKLPWLYPRYKKFLWLNNLTRENE